MVQPKAKFRFQGPWQKWFDGRSEDGKVKGGKSNPHQLDKQAILLLTVHGLFMFANALSGTFINVYLWKENKDFALIAWFALITHIMMALTFFIAGKWVKEQDKMFVLRLGVGVSALFYLVVLLMGKHAGFGFVSVLGIVQGLATGLFWLSYNVVYFEITEPHNRDKFNGWAGLLGSFSGIAAPWISGFIITHMKDLHGYRIIFMLSIALFILGVAASFFLKKRDALGAYTWFQPFVRLSKKGNPWRRVVCALAAQGVREGVFTFMVGLLVYLSTKNEMKLGDYTLVVSVVGLFSFWLTGRILRPSYRSRMMLVGVLAMCSILSLFLWKISYTILLLFGITTALVFPLYTIPMTSSVFDIIGKDEESAKQRVEYVVLRELALNAGRIFGIVVFLLLILWKGTPRVMTTAMIVLGSFPLITWYFMRKRLSIRFDD